MHTPSSGIQIVIESSASDGAGVNSTSSPANVVVVGSVKVLVGAMNPLVNGACSPRRNSLPRPTLTSPSGPSVGNMIPNWWISPRVATGFTSIPTRRRLATMRSWPHIATVSPAPSIAAVPAT